MSNSSLVNYTKISPNRTSPRRHKIDTITIHHMAGNLSVQECGQVFASSAAQASANYGVDSKGRIGLYVNESDRSWASSSPDNDHRAITIEVANSTLSPDWKVSDTAYKALIKLLVDICKRNKIKELKWTGNPNETNINKQNMTVHRWFAPTLCPGPYLFNKMGQIAKDVNKELGVVSTTKPVTETTKPVSSEFKVKVTATALNYRSGPGISYQINGTLKKGEVYTITKIEYNGSTKWGKLKSGAGWISLQYTEKI